MKKCRALHSQGHGDKPVTNPNITNNASESKPDGLKSRGYFEATRGDDGPALLKANLYAFALAYTIAARACWRPTGFNPHGLRFGEAFLGDFENYGMTESNYRSAKAYLAKWGFATFKTTSRGTIARLLDTRLFKVNPPKDDGQNSGQGNRQVTDTVTDRVTTNVKRPDDKSVIIQKRLNDASSQSEIGTKVLTLPVHRLSASFEREMMGRLLTIFKANEMKATGGHWLVNWIRKYPKIFEELLGDLESQLKEGKNIRNPAAWLEKMLQLATRQK
jgi:hypothetical protein